MKPLKFFSENSSLILTIATVALAVITYFYLRETKLIRQIAEKSLQLESSPRVFLAEIVSKPTLKEAEKKIEVTAVFKVKNGGKTEANKFEAEYTFSYGKSMVKDKIGPVQYLFPDQEIRYETKILSVNLNEQDLKVAKEAVETGNPITVKKGVYPPVYIEFNLTYFDREGEKQPPLPYKYKYLFETNTWVSVIE